jgi:MtN3 and saliva related transmembrane protein
VNPEIPRHVTVIGLAAGTLTTVSFLPQLLRTWRLRRADDISGWWLAAFISGVVLWLAYGLFLWSLPIILANAATLALTMAILVMKIWYRERR